MVLRSSAGQQGLKEVVPSRLQKDRRPERSAGIGLPVLSQPLKEERSLIQWMLESEVSRSHEKGSSRALSFYLAV